MSYSYQITSFEMKYNFRMSITGWLNECVDVLFKDIATREYMHIKSYLFL